MIPDVATWLCRNGEPSAPAAPPPNRRPQRLPCSRRVIPAQEATLAAWSPSRDPRAPPGATAARPAICADASGSKPAPAAKPFQRPNPPPSRLTTAPSVPDEHTRPACDRAAPAISRLPPPKRATANPSGAASATPPAIVLVTRSAIRPCRPKLGIAARLITIAEKLPAGVTPQKSATPPSNSRNRNFAAPPNAYAIHSHQRRAAERRLVLHGLDLGC